jgi:hypothetical protein
VTFSQHDSRAIELAYQGMIEDEEDGVLDGTESTHRSSAAAPGNKENTSINEAGDLENAGGRVKVPVNEDYLFDVDVERRELAPVYWLGPIYAVVINLFIDLPTALLVSLLLDIHLL